jgi:hypothetical protein
MMGVMQECEWNKRTVRKTRNHRNQRVNRSKWTGPGSCRKIDACIRQLVAYSVHGYYNMTCQQDNAEVRASCEWKDSSRTPTDLRWNESGVIVSECVNHITCTWWWWVHIHEYSHGRCRRSNEKSSFECKEHTNVWQWRLTGPQSTIIPMHPVCDDYWTPINDVWWYIFLKHPLTYRWKERWSTMNRRCIR